MNDRVDTRTSASGNFGESACKLLHDDRRGTIKHRSYTSENLIPMSMKDPEKGAGHQRPMRDVALSLPRRSRRVQDCLPYPPTTYHP